MDSNSRDTNRELRDWSIIALIILMGLLCLIAAGSLAIRFPPSWKLAASMDSLLDPNSDFLTRRPQNFIEPVNQNILTPPAWLGLFQTPGVTVLPPTPLPTATRPAAATATATEIVPAPATSNPTATPTSTIIYIPVPSTSTSTPAPPVKATNTSPVVVDLQITKDDGVSVYSVNSTLNYTITVTNNGSVNVTGAVVTDTIPVQFNVWNWKCAAQNGGATGCTSTGNSSASFSNTINLPGGASIVYTVRAQVSTTASGDLVNTAAVAVPSGYTESDPSNNTASDTDLFLAASPLPIGNIGSTPDGITDTVAPGDAVTIRFATPLAVNGHASYDLVFYQRPIGTGIMMDIIALEIGDGTNWYTVFYWGDDVADTNSNLDSSVLGVPEIDNQDFSSPPAGLLYNGTGVMIELDGIVPPGIYPYLRIVSPVTAAYPLGADLDGGSEVDAIAILP